MSLAGVVGVQHDFLQKNRVATRMSSTQFMSLAGVVGFEPTRTVLETGMLPLTSYPYVYDITNNST